MAIRPSIVGIRFTDAERKEVETAARYAGLTLSQFIRLHALQAARSRRRRRGRA